MELNNLLAVQEVSLDTANETFLKIDPQVILNIKMSCSTSLKERQDIIQEYIVPDNETHEKKIVNTKLLQNEFLDKATDFLNDLEWFCMSCRYGIADEEILYQSLHTTFLSSVWLLYFHICIRNLKNEDKLFTNIIWLFNRWRKRLRKIQGKAQRKATRAIHKLAVAEEHRKAAQHTLEKAKPKVHSGKPLK